MYLRGKVSPAHAGKMAGVWRRKPHGNTWKKVDTAEISEQGRIRWSWETTEDDAVQDAPYRFQFRIPDHGRSNRVLAWVIFGE